MRFQEDHLTIMSLWLKELFQRKVLSYKIGDKIGDKIRYAVDNIYCFVNNQYGCGNTVVFTCISSLISSPASTSLQVALQALGWLWLSPTTVIYSCVTDNQALRANSPCSVLHALSKTD